MPRDIPSGSPQDWMRRARSDLALARGRKRRGVLSEDVEAVTRQELKTARHIASEVVIWAETMLHR